MDKFLFVLLLISNYSYKNQTFTHEAESNEKLNNDKSMHDLELQKYV